MSKIAHKNTKSSAKNSPKKWSAEVTAKSNALDLKAKAFKANSSEKIAKTLKHSAEKSDRKKASTFQSAMSMLNFYINRAGTNLSAARKKVLEGAKTKLRALFNRKQVQKTHAH